MRTVALALCCAALGVGAAPAYEARLIKDINRNPLSSFAHDFTPVGPITYFVSYSLVYGREIWRTDGTSEGTAIIGEMYPGPGVTGPDALELTRFGDRIAYLGGDVPHDFELWISAGTAASTTVLDLCPGQCSAYPQYLMAVGDHLYFTATYHVFEPEHTTLGIELWRTDGTMEGTHVVRDLAPGVDSSHPQLLGPLGDRLLFFADDQIHGYELWVTDGTAAGTELVTDLTPGPTGSDINYWSTLSTGSVVFFAREDGTRSLWRSDGTADGTVELAAEFPDYFLKRHGSGVVFTGEDAMHGREPWISDGTPAGTRLLVDLFPGSRDSEPRAYGSIGDDILILTRSGFEQAAALWRTDANGENLELLRADDRLDGGTDLVSVGSQVYFATPDVLWMTDGTAAGTRIVEGVEMPEHMGGVEVVDAGGKAIFQADDAVTAGAPWISDGTLGGTFRLADIRMENHSSGIQGMVQLGDKVVFAASDIFGLENVPEEGYGRELWTSDGTEDGTVLVLDLRPGTPDGVITAPVLFQGNVYFGGQSFTQSGLFRSDGTATGTAPVKTGLTVPAQDIIAGSDKLYFHGSQSAFGTELWVSDGTEAGTVMVRDLTPGSGSSSFSSKATCGDLLFFVFRQAASGRELWRSDGTNAGTFLLRDINPGASDSLPSSLRCHQGMLYFGATDGTVGSELWVSDGSAAGTMIVSDIRPGSSSSSPRDIVSYNGALVFVATDATHGTEVWRSDGTADGTMLLLDHRPGSPSSNPKSLSVAGNRLYFLSMPGEPWTVRRFFFDESWSVVEVQEAELPAITLNGAVRIGSSVFFLGSDGLHGEELWITAVECGDAGVDPFEQCDDGNAISGDGCDSNCVPTACGNRILTAGEECDDGNTADGDCCSAACQLEAAGSPCARDEPLACTAEICDGVGTCISSTSAADGAACRSTVGSCDVAEICDGTLFHCPTNAVASADTICRASVATCDSTEHCDGLGPTCPADSMAPAGVLCRESAGVCDQEEACDGATTTCPADGKSTLECRAASGACDVTESCDGSADDCPTDATAPDGTSCANGEFCDGAETCQAGACGSSDSPCLQGCDETIDICTAACTPLPQPSCRQAASSFFSMSDNDDDVRDVLSWRWGKGDATTAGEFGDPTGETEQAICIYDAQSGLIAEARVAPGDHWRSLSDRGFKLTNRTAAHGALSKALLKAGDEGRAKVTVKGEGTSLPNIELPLAAPRFPLLVQLVNSDTGICWESRFAAEHARTNSDNRLKLKR